MKLISRFGMLLILGVVGLAEPAHAGTRDLCGQAANIILRESGDVNPQTGQVTYGCLCSPPQSDYKEFMDWCQNQASASELTELQQDMQSSMCANPINVSHCVRN